MTSLAADRQKFILEAARQEGGVIISAIARELGVSEMTVRRDLKELDGRGLVRRVHGGAVASPQAKFVDRMSKRSPAKAKAASKLIPYLPTSGTIYLDGSTTMLHLAEQLQGAENLQVVTNHIETFQRLYSVNGVEPLLIGGKLDPRTDTLVGSLALRSLLAIAFDAAFLSAWGLSENLGLTELTLEDAEVKEQVASRSSRVYLALDSDKLGTTGAGTWSPDRSKSILATELSDTATLEPYRERFAEII